MSATTKPIQVHIYDRGPTLYNLIKGIRFRAALAPVIGQPGPESGSTLAYGNTCRQAERRARIRVARQSAVKTFAID